MKSIYREYNAKDIMGRRVRWTLFHNGAPCSEGVCTVKDVQPVKHGYNLVADETATGKDTMIDDNALGTLLEYGRTVNIMQGVKEGDMYCRYWEII